MELRADKIGKQEGWAFQPIGNGIFLLSGHHVLAQHCNSKGYGTPYLTGPSDFPSGQIEHSKYTDRPSTLCQQGDILVTVKGSGVGTMVLSDAEYCISRQLMAIRPKEWIGEFLYYSLLQNAGAIAAASTGLIPGLSRSDIAEQHIPIPPLPEQRAIAAALTDADALIASLDALVAKKRALKQAVMQQLLTGKTRLPGFKGKWEMKRLGEIGEAIIGLTYKPSDVVKDGLLVLRSSNVQDGRLRFDDNVYVSVAVPDRIIVKQGDILICVRNGSRELIGKSAKITTEAEGSTFGAFMAVFRTTLHPFIHHQLQSDVVKRQIHEHLGATINQITNKSLNSFEVPLPVEPEEQAAIATILSDMGADLAALEGKRDKACALKQGMMQELLTGRIRLA
jgi:type I restriction enzyme S subunit